MANADEYPEYRDYLRLKFGSKATLDELPEYSEYLKKRQSSTEIPCEIIQKDQSFDFFDQLERQNKFPFPCKEITDIYGNYNFYCIALFLLWFMLIVSAILYQFRSIINIKSKIIRNTNSQTTATTNSQGEIYNNGHTTNRKDSLPE